MAELVKISASRLKKFQSCSWQYWCSYHLKLPDKTNYGALMGTECHTVFECLLNPRHRALYDAVMAKPATITNVPAIERHVKRYMKKNGLPDELFDQIDTMILVGLSTDFFCKGGTLLQPELSFEIKNENPRYRIGGLIDKPAEYNGKFIRIADYKSSKKKFEGDDLKINVQAMMYSLAAKKLWPHLIPVVDFIFLQFPDDPIQRLKFTDGQLRGFELFLADIQAQMNTFDIKAAKANMAGKQKMPKNGEGFKGPLLCGWAGKGFVSHPDQKKKNGDPSYYCPFKFEFDYYALCNEAGDVLRTSKTEGELVPKVEKGEFVVKKHYGGCPHFQKKPMPSF